MECYRADAVELVQAPLADRVHAELRGGKKTNSYKARHQHATKQINSVADRDCAVLVQFFTLLLASCLSIGAPAPSSVFSVRALSVMHTVCPDTPLPEGAARSQHYGDC